MSQELKPSGPLVSSVKEEQRRVALHHLRGAAEQA
jgi:hypothetical protein